MDLIRLSILGLGVAFAFAALPAFAQLGAGLHTDLSLEHDGMTRVYDVYVPGAGAGQPRPLVIDLHGFGDDRTGQRNISGFDALADREGFIVAFPDGVGNAWNPSLGGDRVPLSNNADEEGFLRQLVAAIDADTPVDPQRVYATGLSLGGDMAQALACGAADVFAAAALVAARFPIDYELRCNPIRPVPILMFRGDTDQLVPYDGGTGNFPAAGPTQSAAATLNIWRDTNQCTSAAETTFFGTVARCEVYRNCAAGAETGLCTVRSSDTNGHVLYVNADLNIAGRSWDFFRAHRLPEIAGEPFAINYGLAGGWFNPLTAGQGFLFDFTLDSEFMFVAAFTFDAAGAAKGGVIEGSEQRWFTAQGNYSGSSADLTIFQTLGGVFDDPTEPVTTAVGTMGIEFDSCTEATISYDLPDFGLSGVIPVVKLLADEICTRINDGEIELKRGPRTAPVPSGSAQAINYGLIGGWFDPATAGQGFLFDFLLADEFMFVAWFTFESASGALKGGAIPGDELRWFTAQGAYTPNRADLTVFATRSGVFDDPTMPTTDAVGTMGIEFEDCTNATISYDLPGFGLTGEIAATKLLADEICTAINEGSIELSR